MKLKDIIGFVVIFSLFAIYLLINKLSYGSSPNVMFGYGLTHITSSVFTFYCLVPTTLMNVLYIVLASCFIVFIAAFAQIKGTKYLWLVMIIYGGFIICSGFATRVPHGRYYDSLFPLLLISAFTYSWREDRRLLAVGAGISIFSLVTVHLFTIDTINSFSNLYFSLPEWIFFVLPAVSLIFLVRTKNKKTIKIVIFVVLLCTFVAGNIINFQYVKQATDNAYEDAVIGRRIVSNDLSNITYDPGDYRTFWASYCLLNYYNSDFIPLEINPSNSSYFISSQDLQYEVLAEQKQFKVLEEETNKTLHLYKVR